MFLLGDLGYKDIIYLLMNCVFKIFGLGIFL